MQAALELKAAQRKPAELAGPLLPYLARAKGRTGQGAGGRPLRCQTPTVWTADRQETSHPRAVTVGHGGDIIVVAVAKVVQVITSD